MNRELIAQLYSSDDGKKRAAVYRFLFDRRHDLLDELKKAASFEENEDIAVFMAQVCLNLETFVRDTSLERQILELLNKDGGIYDISVNMWEYLVTTGTSSMLIGVMGVLGKTIPTNAQDFMEACLNHLDPEIRAMACQVAINSGRPTHFAHVLSLIADPDPIVSETAFMVIKNLPPEQMVIILDYALGSPDEWVLQNVAAFLPLIINRELRKIIAKHQYHSHPLVSKKAREALKEFDAIPVTSQKKKEEKVQEQILAEEATEEKAHEKVLSFKEQMELKKQQKLEEERQKLEEEELLSSELAKVDSQELESFGHEIEEFSREADGSPSETEPVPDDQAPFVENADFEKELHAFENIDLENLELDLDAPADDSESETVRDIEATKDIGSGEEGQKIEDSDQMLSSAENDQAPLESIESPVIIDLAAASDELDALMKSNDTQPDESQSIPVDDSDDPIVVDTTQPPQQPAPAETSATKSSDTGAAEPKPGMIAVEPDSAAQYIMAKYPSFIQMPYSSLFEPGRPEVLLKALQLTADHLVGYLNLCFIQSCLFFATPSEMLERSIKDCLKGHLVGPIAIRCLHNFALAMKQSRENPIFFTFTLSQVFSESSDTNPLMLLRELAEYLNDPIAPLEETIPQAVEGMTEILRGCKAIMNNTLVMKAPRGAKEPFADLSGPLAQVLPVDKRPALDLPEGEVILISRDGGEALGLFPFFKYSKRRVHFARPDEAEMKILLERLEIDME